MVVASQLSSINVLLGADWGQKGINLNQVQIILVCARASGILERCNYGSTLLIVPTRHVKKVRKCGSQNSIHMKLGQEGTQNQICKQRVQTTNGSKIKPNQTVAGMTVLWT